MVEILPWVMSFLTIWMMILAGNKSPYTWVLGLFNQCLWSGWILGTQTWGLLPMNIALWIVYWRNSTKWERA